MSQRPKHLRAIDKQILIEFYKVQWNDIHDMNDLDWRVALIFIPLIGAFSAVVGILSRWMPTDIKHYTQSIQVFALVAFLLCLYGLWTVAKGQAHTILKFKTLSDVEEYLCLHGYIYERPECFGFWRVIVCRRFLLFIVYLVLGLLTLSIAVVPIDRWSFSLSVLGQPLVWLVVIAIIILGTHYRDYKLHLKSRETC